MKEASKNSAGKWVQMDGSEISSDNRGWEKRKSRKCTPETKQVVDRRRMRLEIKKLDRKIEEAQRLDGKYLLMCIDLKLTKEEIASAYFGKDGIEKAFRSMKGTACAQ